MTDKLIQLTPIEQIRITEMPKDRFAQLVKDPSLAEKIMSDNRLFTQAIVLLTDQQLEKIYDLDKNEVNLLNQAALAFLASNRYP